ncbi:MAG: primosomal protein N' [Firmicutes bacterium]|nr:primosomal protein N' [Bacillota bacterium]
MDVVEGNIAEVYVDVAVHEVDRVFHYAIPSTMTLRLGQAVRVPFGWRSVVGVVVGFCTESPFPRLKNIGEVLYNGDSVVTEEQLELARLLADYYLCPLSLILRQMIPFRLDSSSWPRPKTKKVLVPVVEAMPSDLSARAVKQRELLAALLQRGELSQAEITSPSAAKQLVKKGYAREVVVPVKEEPLVSDVTSLIRPPTLTNEQEAVLQSLLEALTEGQTSTWLLHGVTGSGKTEIYLRLIQEALLQGKQCLMLVPEISLTPQAVARFQARFGSQVAVWHSALTPRERFNEWKRIKSNEAQIVIGARSAIFVPLTRLGVIILDEEHEHSYQQEENPRYHTRIVAQLRQRTTGSLLLLGSATPALETYAASESGKCHRLELRQRVSKRPLPAVHVVDMREEFRAGHKGLLSRRLEYALNECLVRQEQAIILLNRRGFANYLLCPDCGAVPFCPRCDISLTYHRRDQCLRCHYCGHEQDVLRVCSECGSDQLKAQGVGTEQLEAYLAERFSQARIARMDRDTTTKRDAHERLLRAFGQGQYDILVGTQMIAKGLDFPRVTLVGVVGADSGLYVPDFRSSERTFQLLTQVAGRAGRGDRPGEVIFQAFNTEHYAIECAKNHDYWGFYRQEMAVRRHGAYPPLGYMITLLFTSEDEAELVEDAVWLAELLAQHLEGVGQIIGPAPCSVSKIKDNWRWQLIVKSGQRMRLRQIVAQALEEYRNHKRRTQIILEFDA